jgi:hypothetical protein
MRLPRPTPRLTGSLGGLLVVASLALSGCGGTNGTSNSASNGISTPGAVTAPPKTSGSPGPTPINAAGELVISGPSGHTVRLGLGGWTKAAYQARPAGPRSWGFKQGCYRLLVKESTPAAGAASTFFRKVYDKAARPDFTWVFGKPATPRTWRGVIAAPASGVLILIDLHSDACQQPSLDAQTIVKAILASSQVS